VSDYQDLPVTAARLAPPTSHTVMEFADPLRRESAPNAD
jgi:hypothetical protein